MPSLSISLHPSAAASPLRVTQARLRVLRRIVFAAAQVAALFFDGSLLRTREAFAAPAGKGGVSCSNCGWWPWNDNCIWVESGYQDGISYFEISAQDDRTLQATEETGPLTWVCDCAIAVSEKEYKWMPAVKASVQFPPIKALQAVQITGEWDANKLKTTTISRKLSGEVPIGKCGHPMLYCYQTRKYHQTLYRRQLGTVTGVTVDNLPMGITVVKYTYSYSTCDSPCQGDSTVIEGRPTPQLTFDAHDRFEKALANACQ